MSTRPSRTTCDRTGAFTLLELVLVIVILAALSAVIIPLYRDHQFEAQANAMAYTVKAVRARLQAHNAEHGNYPNTIDPSWFDRPLANGWANEVNATNIWTSWLPANLYPSEKTFDDSDANVMWYNRVNGSFCIRVPPQGSTAASIALFNRVNDTAVTTLSQTK